jgi:hypothetical protein
MRREPRGARSQRIGDIWDIQVERKTCRSGPVREDFIPFARDVADVTASSRTGPLPQ